MAQARLCPTCKRELDQREDTLRFRPFCSKRCADIDLGRWLKGAYAIPSAEAEEGEPDSADQEPGNGESGEAGDVSRARQ